MSSNPYNPDDLIPIGDAARILGVSLETVRRWNAAGRITAMRTVGGQRRFKRSDVEALISEPQSA